MKSFENNDAWRKFQKYLRRLAKNGKKKPFNCPHLAVLPEEVSYHSSINIIPNRGFENLKEEYVKDSLLCCEKPGKEGMISTIRCTTLDRQIALNAIGTLVIPCTWNGSEFLFTLASFAPNPKK